MEPLPVRPVVFFAAAAGKLGTLQAAHMSRSTPYHIDGRMATSFDTARRIAPPESPDECDRNLYIVADSCDHRVALARTRIHNETQ